MYGQVLKTLKRILGQVRIQNKAVLIFIEAYIAIKIAEYLSYFSCYLYSIKNSLSLGGRRRSLNALQLTLLELTSRCLTIWSCLKVCMSSQCPPHHWTHATILSHNGWTSWSLLGHQCYLSQGQRYHLRFFLTLASFSQ